MVHKLKTDIVLYDETSEIERDLGAFGSTSSGIRKPRPPFHAAAKTKCGQRARSGEIGQHGGELRISGSKTGAERGYVY